MADANTRAWYTGPQDDQALAAIGCIEHPADRYVAAHRAAEQLALVVISATPGRVRGRHDVWELLARRAPYLAEWAAFFGYLSTRVQVVAAGERAIVVEREADDLVRDLERFVTDIARRVDFRRGVS
ncbi:MAG: SAV_6107 family HEPN domain-containing protein [Propionibacteriaceae bacterium]|nr:SAV_6107 family HEPN domain-containing protein [Propionibacteriaceae bacterium]